MIQLRIAGIGFNTVFSQASTLFLTRPQHLITALTYNFSELSYVNLTCRPAIENDLSDKNFLGLVIRPDITKETNKCNFSAITSHKKVPAKDWRVLKMATRIHLSAVGLFISLTIRMTFGDRK